MKNAGPRVEVNPNNAIGIATDKRREVGLENEERLAQ